MNTRRQFLITAPLGLIGAVVSCRGNEQAATAAPPPGAPPTFGTLPVA
ncbi:MAG: hypothetical protein HYR75_03280, partial [Gemmatimonadetes bacterium]|nr:hypothetical protein [Gemmatimonadota bacterium]